MKIFLRSALSLPAPSRIEFMTAPLQVKKNYYNLAVEKDRDPIFTTVTTIWKAGLSHSLTEINQRFGIV
jgi:hypothetical protein